MPARLKSLLQYVAILAVTALLIWFSLRGLNVGNGENKFDYLLDTWDSAHKGWLFVMAAVAMLSHAVRTQRWRMILRPLGHRPSFTNGFLSLMVGYLVNLVIPRGGEVSRCYNLYKLDKIPVEQSFGTVVIERITDLLCLLLLIAIAFIVESQKLFAFIDTLPIGQGGGGNKLTLLLYAAIVLIVLIGVGYWLVRRSGRVNNFVVKTWQGFKGGLLSVFKLENKGLYIIYSILIWVLYFFMSYAVIKAFPATGALGIGAVLSLFAIGSIAMAAPLPGGTGSYHVLVPQGLVFLYDIPQADAVAFTFIFHGWQTAIMIIAGAVSLVVTSVLVKKNSGVD